MSSAARPSPFAALKSKKFWLRLAPFLVAAVALYYVFSRINFEDVLRVWRDARPAWLVTAIAVYGLTFLAGAWRWHLMLGLTRCSVRAAVAARMTVIGHFFYTIFFGMAGGDFAKSALFARWYQFPLPEVLAASSLDRLLGLGGLMIFVALAFGLAAVKGGFTQWRGASLNLPVGWLVLLFVMVTLAILAVARWGRASMLGRMLRAVVEGGKRLLVSKGILIQGLICGALVQAALAGNLALSLQTVSHTVLPWGQLAWTFPVIAMISALPISVAGLGFREGAAMVLLGLYGVPAADAVAASLLTLVARLFWAAVGGLILWRERRDRARACVT